jgi:hypothetical protein
LLFHYTDAARADAIIEERCFVSGPGVARGLGIYATDIAPLGVETIEDVIVHCFRGEGTSAEVSHAVAVRRSAGDLQFEQTDDPYQWVLSTGKLTGPWSAGRQGRASGVALARPHDCAVEWSDRIESLAQRHRPSRF